MTMRAVHRKCFLNLFMWIFVIHTCPDCGKGEKELKSFTSCNNVLDMELQKLFQSELHLTISDLESSGTRVSCDFTIQAGTGKNVMFYFTELYLGSPNRSERIDESCIEPRDVNGHYESVPNGSCRTSERKCKNDRCIAHEIVCNDHNPCGDYSDCPTGLEHLSSWEMSGIVILALLCGGIVIIMASVCLQRTRSKRYDWGELERVPANGSIQQDQVEMNVVVTMQQKPADDHNDKRRHKGKQYPKNERGNSCLALPEYTPSLNGPPLENDKEKLIQSKLSSPDSLPENIQNENIVSPVDVYSDKTQNHPFTCSTASLMGDRLSRDFLSFDKHPPLISNTVSHSSIHACSPDCCRYSDNSLIYSDSDSRDDDDDDNIQIANLERTK